MAESREVTCSGGSTVTSNHGKDQQDRSLGQPHLDALLGRIVEEDLGAALGGKGWEPHGQSLRTGPFFGRLFEASSNLAHRTKAGV